mmetsp:Transcript_77686/g.168021  ORF Transcript_77686/g.168021 Transcript_77686/m.168021 type:complete len:343 (+) Transcript_77686:169-1197(+)|eukprot:CAMPEP_0116917674 /NCGR_PEP_ID=MMETSP0467-20121206/19301_1 /TAXON_ID=283647 /ORGANISM="Mesodinium pulex, Strain SPMC105" /LENGTH=342 /DNA_ID=CAMNT_0004594847 /DNA_START=102 /DNA_END=1130 /DNA_ORIENTATION=-
MSEALSNIVFIVFLEFDLHDLLLVEDLESDSLEEHGGACHVDYAFVYLGVVEFESAVLLVLVFEHVLHHTLEGVHAVGEFHGFTRDGLESGQRLHPLGELMHRRQAVLLRLFVELLSEAQFFVFAEDFLHPRLLLLLLALLLGAQLHLALVFGFIRKFLGGHQFLLLLSLLLLLFKSGLFLLFHELDVLQAGQFLGGGFDFLLSALGLVGGVSCASHDKFFLEVRVLLVLLDLLHCLVDGFSLCKKQRLFCNIFAETHFQQLVSELNVNHGFNGNLGLEGGLSLGVGFSIVLDLFILDVLVTSIALDFCSDYFNFFFSSFCIFTNFSDFSDFLNQSRIMIKI